MIGSLRAAVSRPRLLRSFLCNICTVVPCPFFFPRSLLQFSELRPSASSLYIDTQYIVLIPPYSLFLFVSRYSYHSQTPQSLHPCTLFPGSSCAINERTTVTIYHARLLTALRIRIITFTCRRRHPISSHSHAAFEPATFFFRLALRLWMVSMDMHPRVGRCSWQPHEALAVGCVGETRRLEGVRKGHQFSGTNRCGMTTSTRFISPPPTPPLPNANAGPFTIYTNDSSYSPSIGTHSTADAAECDQVNLQGILSWFNYVSAKW